MARLGMPAHQAHRVSLQQQLARNQQAAAAGASLLCQSQPDRDPKPTDISSKTRHTFPRPRAHSPAASVGTNVPLSNSSINPPRALAEGDNLLKNSHIASVDNPLFASLKNSEIRSVWLHEHGHLTCLLSRTGGSQMTRVRGRTHKSPECAEACTLAPVQSGNENVAGFQALFAVRTGVHKCACMRVKDHVM